MIRKILKNIALCVLASLVTLPAMPAHAAEITESKMQAVYIRRFLTLDVTWPADYKPGGSSVGTNLCVIGDGNFTDMKAVFDAASKKDNRAYKLIKKTDIKSVDDCHALYISRSEEAKLGGYISQLGSSPVLTVSDISGFAAQGGMIEFSIEKNNIVVGTINHKATKAAQLALNAGLLEVARKVIDE